MRKKLIISALAATSLCTPVLASADGPSKEESIGVGAGATIGAIAGGPLGLIIGAAIGAKVGDEFSNRNEEIDSLQASLNGSYERERVLQARVRDLHDDVQRMDTDVERLQHLARPELLSLMKAGIEMDLLFRTDEDALSASTDARLQQLAASLSAMPEIRVQLDGFADERGDEAYNQKLSERRVQHVYTLLVAAGVDQERIRVLAHGERQAADKTPDDFALQRKVSLKLYLEDEAHSFAANPTH